MKRHKKEFRAKIRIFIIFNEWWLSMLSFLPNIFFSSSSSLSSLFELPWLSFQVFLLILCPARSHSLSHSRCSVVCLDLFRDKEKKIERRNTYAQIGITSTSIYYVPSHRTEIPILFFSKTKIYCSIQTLELLPQTHCSTKMKKRKKRKIKPNERASA